jgi:hypothetical protein
MRRSSVQSRLAKMRAATKVGVAIGLLAGKLNASEAYKTRALGYTNRVPVRPGAVQHGVHLDFFLAGHNQYSPMQAIENQIIASQKGKSPYTMILLEAADMNHAQKKEFEMISVQLNALIRSDLQIIELSKTKYVSKSVLAKAKARVERHQKGDTMTQKLFLAAKHGLKIKLAESYSDEELSQHDQLVHRKFNNKDDFKQAYKKYIKIRNDRIAHTLHSLSKSESGERGLVILGTTHHGVVGLMHKKGHSASRVVHKSMPELGNKDDEEIRRFIQEN